MKPEQPAADRVLYHSSVQILILIIISIFVASALLMVLTYFRPSLPTWLDELIFNPVLLVFFLSPFTGSESELSFVIFNPTLFAILLLPIVYVVLFRPWVRRMAERQKAEEVRLENERIEYARKVKTEFLINMSHELRTHLNSILGFSELMKLKTTGELNAKQSSYVSNILTGGNMLLEIINDLLDLNKIEMGKTDMVIEKLSVPQTIDETIALIKEKAEKQKVLLKKEFDSQLEFIETDKHVFRQILFNLLSNAVKFSKDEGGVVVITAEKEGDMAKISVSDTGVGIRGEDLSKLFTQFPHIDSGLTRKPEGTGLGLAITKRLVELCGGKIWAESEFGEGSTFTFLLPLKAEKKMESR